MPRAISCQVLTIHLEDLLPRKHISLKNHFDERLVAVAQIRGFPKVKNNGTVYPRIIKQATPRRNHEILHTNP